MKKVNLVLALLCAVISVSSCKKTEPIVAANNTSADGKAKYLRLLEEKFGSHKYVKQYKEYLEFPQKVEEISCEVEKVYELKYEGQFADRYPGIGPHGIISYSEIGFYSKKGDMWFTGIQAGTRSPGSFSISNGKVEFYEGPFDKRPWGDNTIVDQKEYDDAEKSVKGIYDGYVNFLSAGIGSLILYDGYLDIERKDDLDDVRENYLDTIVFCCNLDKDKLSSVRVIPFSSDFRHFSGSFTDFRNVDSFLNIYYELRETNDPVKKVLMVYNYPTRDYYLFTLGKMEEVDPSENEMGYHFLIGEDDNLYYQIATDKAYHIFRITPHWDKVIKTQDYVSAIGEFYPKYKEDWDALSD